ncbi:MAG: hypothetical protein JOZ95_03930, partial [Solirubrobacterales bacterium]|nr:hypothetical protein [Solirubrobacterales bacterium]
RLPFTGLANPHGVAVDGQGNVFVADSGNDRIVELSPSGSQTVLPFAGLNLPDAVSVDSSGNVFVLDETNGGRVVELSGAGTQTTLPFAGLDSGDGMAVDGGGDVSSRTSTIFEWWRCLPGARRVYAAAQTTRVMPTRTAGSAAGVAAWPMSRGGYTPCRLPPNLRRTEVRRHIR